MPDLFMKEASVRLAFLVVRRPVLFPLHLMVADNVI